MNWYKTAQSQQLQEFFKDVVEHSKYDRNAKNYLKKILKDEFHLQGVPINTSKLSPNTSNFILDNYSKLQQATQINPTLTWSIILPQEDYFMLDNLINFQNRFNQIDREFVSSLDLSNKFNFDFYAWSIREYSSDNPYNLDLKDIYNWCFTKQTNPATHSFRDIYYMMQDKYSEEEMENLEALPKGHIPNQEITINGKTMYMIQLRTKKELDYEGKVMDHCVGSYYEQIKDQITKENTVSEIYSLRDQSGKSYATIELKYPFIKQIQGPKNTRLLLELNKYVKQWAVDNEVLIYKAVEKELKESVHSPDYLQKVRYYEDMVINSGDSNYIYMFARDIPGVDVSKLQEVMINRGDADNIYYFARDIPGADISRLQEAIINSGDVRHIYWFAEDIPRADIDRLQEVIINGGDEEYIYYFARDIPGADISRLQEAIINGGDTRYIYYFARNIPGADINRLQEAIINSGDTRY